MRYEIFECGPVSRKRDGMGWDFLEIIWVGMLLGYLG